jgi:decaprenylphospho-beta-D-erythro-pentofuranosid-2-ulose 2-reductase
VYLFFGILGDNARAQSETAELEAILRTDFTAAAQWCQAAAAHLERQRSGALIVITSVAGDRGRQSNYAYGAAKAGLTVFVEGLAHRLAPSGARAVAVKLGQVDTAMTRGGGGRSGPTKAKPHRVAGPLADMALRPTAPVVYLPWFWRPIMAVIRALPASIMHRTRL